MMTALILSDILTLKKVAKLYILISIFYAAIGLFSGGGSNMISFIVFFGVMFVVSSFGYNDICHWDRYVNTAPIYRKDYVMAKYIFSFIVSVVTGVLGIGMIILSGMIRGVPVKEDLIAMLIVILIGHIYMMLMLPVLFKYPAEKARVFLMLVFLVPFAVIMLVSKTVPAAKVENIFELMKQPWFLPAAVVCIIMLTIFSFIFSVGIYKKKEF